MIPEDVQKYMNSRGFAHIGALNTGEFLGFPPGRLRLLSVRMEAPSSLQRLWDWLWRIPSHWKIDLEIEVVDDEEPCSCAPIDLGAIGFHSVSISESESLSDG